MDAKRVEIKILRLTNAVVPRAMAPTKTSAKAVLVMVLRALLPQRCQHVLLRTGARRPTDAKVSTTPSSNRFTITLVTLYVALTALSNPACEFGRENLSDCAAPQEIDFQALRGDWLTPRETDELLLVGEMHHRFANTLSVLTSVLRCELLASASPELMDKLARYEARIVAFGNLHRSLVVGAASNWISVGHYIEDLCKALSETILEPLGVRCEVIVEGGEFPGERCERLGLVIAELVMNAARHAFHNRDGGLVRVEFVNGVGSWACIVSYNGDGTAMASHGVGSKILKQLVRALGGNLVRKSGRDGTSVIVTCRA
jgi:two-component sensor histidine kinase